MRAIRKGVEEKDTRRQSAPRMAAKTGVMTARIDETAGDFCFVQSKIAAPTRNASQPAVTAVQYATLQNAYDHFDSALFAGCLPQVLITLQRHRRARGYFSAERFQDRSNCRARVHEVALNPDTFNGRTDEEILSTLVHEMVHVWQREHGQPGRGRYHNREWAAKMHSIGLMPSDTGKPGGVVTGDHVSHYILADGPSWRHAMPFLSSTA